MTALVWIVDIAVVLVYFGVGAKLTNDAYHHLRNPRKDLWYPPIFEPEKFTPEGNRLRIRAVRFWNWVGLIVLLYFVFVS